MVALRFVTISLLVVYFIAASITCIQNLQDPGSGSWVAFALAYGFIAFNGLLLYNARKSGYPRVLTITAFLISLLPVALLMLVVSLLSGMGC